MNKAEAIKRWESGEQCMCVEFLSSKAETITWRDKVSRGVMTAPILTHTVITKDGAAIAGERVDEKTFDPHKYVSPYKRGDKLFVSFIGSNTEKGRQSLSGCKIERIE